MGVFENQVDEAPISLQVLADTSGVVRIDGNQTNIQATGDADTTRSVMLDLLVQTAAQRREPIQVRADDPDGQAHLIIYPDGNVDVHEEPQPPVSLDTAPTPLVTVTAPTHGAYTPQPAVSAPVPAPDPAVAEQPQTRREARQSFLHQETIEEPAARGFRGALSKVGIRLAPSEAERAVRADERAVSQNWPGPRVTAIANGKGGVGKTMTTIELSAVFARYGGAGVLAYDNNQTRGTLGWSTEQGPHDASVLDLLPQVQNLLGTGAQSADLARYVHHQSRDRYDVLRSKPEVLATEQRFDAQTVDQVLAVAQKFYRLVFVDSGNDETDPMWLRAVEGAHQLVVPTIGEAKSAESAALLLEGLHARGGHFAKLAERAVVVVSQHKHDLRPQEIAAIVEGFRPLAREVVSIPYDAALGADNLSYGTLQPRTQRAWLAAGAAVARGL